MSGFYVSLLKVLTVVQLCALGACSAAAAVGAGEVEDVNQTGDRLGGFSGTTGAPGSAAFNFSDDFETPGTWKFFSSTRSGIGYVSPRLAEARSPTRVGDEYDRRGASGYQVLSRTFALPTDADSCRVSVFVKPLSAMMGQLQLLDATNKTPLASQPFRSTSTSDWFQVTATTLSGLSSNALSVRVELDHDGTWQEFLVDDLTGNCQPRP